MMYHGAVDMVIESHSKQLVTRIAKPKYAEAQGQRSSDSHEKHLFRLKLIRSMEALADAFFQPVRYGNIPDRLLEPLARVATLLGLLRTRIAASEVLNHFEIAFCQQFVIDIRIELRTELPARVLTKSCFSHNLLPF
jgi:hypothetical protein